MESNFTFPKKFNDPEFGRRAFFVLKIDRPTSIFAMVVLSAGLGLMSSAAAAGEATRAHHENRAAVESVPEGHVLQRRQYLMGTWLEVTIRAHDRTRALDATEAAFAAVAEAERRLSTWREDSELAQVNFSPSNQSVQVSPLLARDLGEAMRWHDATQGAFSPGLGALISAWDLRGDGRLPNEDALRVALAATAITGPLVVGRRLQLGSHGLRIEEGGFGKGAGLRDALAAARSHGASCAILDFGGQVAVGGACSDTTIAISNPDDRHLEVASLTLETGSAATSGLNQRFFTVNGVRHGHILDPRSGRPVDDWGAVTVIAADPLDADCVSTALYVMGPDSGVTWAANHPEIEAIFAENTAGGLRLRATAGLRDRLSTPSDLAVEWIAGIEARHHGPPPSAR